MKHRQIQKKFLLLIFLLLSITSNAASNSLFKDFVDYVSVFSHGEPAGKDHIPSIDFSHPFSQQAILPEVFKEISAKHLKKDLLKNSIAKSRFVEKTLCSESQSLPIENLIKAYKYSIGSREELEILKKLAAKLSREGKVFPDTVLKVLNLYKMRSLSIAQNQFPKSISRASITGEKFQAFSMRKNWSKSLTREFKEFLVEFGLNEIALAASAKTLTFLGKQNEAKSLLARALLINQNTKSIAEKDPTLKALLPQDNSDKAFLPGVEVREYDGIDQLELNYSLNSQKKQSKILIWDNGSFLEKKSNVRIPSWVISQLMVELQNSTPSDSPLTKLIMLEHRPKISIKIHRNRLRSPIFIFSNSNTPLMLPVNFYQNNKLSHSYSENTGKLLLLLSSWLGISHEALQSSKQAESSWTPISNDITIKSNFSFPELASLEYTYGKSRDSFMEKVKNEIRNFPVWEMTHSETYLSTEEKNINDFLLIAQFKNNSRIRTSKEIKIITWAINDRNNKTKWLTGESNDFFSTVEIVEQSLLQSIGFEKSTTLITPFHGDIDFDAFPGLTGCYRLCEFLTEHSLSFEDTGKYNSVLKTKQTDMETGSEIETIFLPGAQSHVITDLVLHKKAIICPMGNQLLAFILSPESLFSDITKIKYTKGKITLSLNNTTEKSNLHNYLSTLKMNGLKYEVTESQRNFNLQISLTNKDLMIGKNFKLFVKTKAAKQW